MTLTERQRDVYQFIRQHIKSKGYGPTVREIAKQFSIKSANGVLCHLKALEKKGKIVRDLKLARGIRLTERAELSDLEGNTHSFEWMFHAGNSITRDGDLLDRDGKKIGSVMRVGGNR